MEQETTNKIEVKVGGWDREGAFTGQIIRFTGEEVAHYKEFHGQTSSQTDRGTDYTIYKVIEDSYRVHIETWSCHQGEESYANLLPNSGEDETDDPYGELAKPIDYRRTYTEKEVRARYPQVFAASGEPNIIDLD